ncbi:GDYXXLXY domain-containing protein [Paralcaligenes ginsengisoli]
MQVDGSRKVHASHGNWVEFFRKTTFSLGSLLLASAAICWIAANWAHATAFQKLAGAQAVMAIIILVACLLERYPLTHKDRNFSVSANLTGLAGVAIGALLALVGQIYQTGADSWQLFAWWALLLLPWLIAVRTVFLGLLWVLVVNVGVILYFGFTDGWMWLPAYPFYLEICLGLAALDSVLLWCWECRIGQFGDRWRIGPRVLGAVVPALLVGAVLTCFGSPSSYSSHFVALLGLGVTGFMAWIYTRIRPDLAMVCLAAVGAFTVVTVDLLSFIQSELALLGLILILMLFSGVLLRWLSRRPGVSAKAGASPYPHVRGDARDPWFLSAFRLLVMWITASLIIALLVLSLDLQIERLWIAGLVLCGAGLLVCRTTSGVAMREAGATVAAAGLFLACLSWHESLTLPRDTGVAAMVLASVLIYAAGANFALRFFAACLAIWAFLDLTWTDFSWYWVLDDSLFGKTAAPVQAFLDLSARLLPLSLAALGAFYAGSRYDRREFWSPLAWSLAVSAQSLAWLMPSTGIVLALAWMVLGFALGRRTLQVFGVAGLLACLARYYYLLDTSLLHKAFLLGVAGAALVVVWALLRLRMQASKAAAGRDAPLWLRRAGLLGGLLLVLCVVNISTYKYRQILQTGQRVVLALSPVDPRSLIQGDYMALNFALVRPLRRMLASSKEYASLRHGYMILQPDAQGVYQLQSIQFQPRADQGVALEFRLRGPDVRIVTNGYFFPEGQARRFEAAKYGEFRVARDGTGLLTRLLDADMKPL